MSIMGYNINRRSAPTASRIIETDAATCSLVRHIVRDIRTLEHEAANRRELDDHGKAELDTAASFRRFVTRTLDAASDAVRTQLSKEGTWT